VPLQHFLSERQWPKKNGFKFKVMVEMDFCGFSLFIKKQSNASSASIGL
jgi:hypothetical protein